MWQRTHPSSARSLPRISNSCEIRKFPEMDQNLHYPRLLQESATSSFKNKVLCWPIDLAVFRRTCFAEKHFGFEWTHQDFCCWPLNLLQTDGMRKSKCCLLQGILKAPTKKKVPRKLLPWLRPEAWSKFVDLSARPKMSRFHAIFHGFEANLRTLNSSPVPPRKFGYFVGPLCMTLKIEVFRLQVLGFFH